MARRRRIVVRLISGLGNQFFQYALGRAVAARSGLPLWLDAAYVACEPRRAFALAPYRLAARVAGPYPIAPRRLNDARWDQPLARARFGATVRRDRRFVYDPAVLEAPAGAYLIGYWQTERYFAPLAEAIRDELRLRELGLRAREIAAAIAAAPVSAAVHVRRGDYVTDPHARERFGLCDADYYARAARAIAVRAADPRFFVFSDDPAWCRDNLDLPGETTVVSGGTTAHEDLHLISLCHHAAIANSSFGWWGAWLGETPDSVIVAPRVWFRAVPFDTGDVVPARWLRF